MIDQTYEALQYSHGTHESKEFGNTLAKKAEKLTSLESMAVLIFFLLNSCGYLCNERNFYLLHYDSPSFWTFRFQHNYKPWCHRCIESSYTLHSLSAQWDTVD